MSNVCVCTWWRFGSDRMRKCEELCAANTRKEVHWPARGRRAQSRRRPLARDSSASTPISKHFYFRFSICAKKFDSLRTTLIARASSQLCNSLGLSQQKTNTRIHKHTNTQTQLHGGKIKYNGVFVLHAARLGAALRRRAAL